MLYTVSLVVPPATPASDPVSAVLTLTHGRITFAWLQFPPGPRGEVHVALFHKLYQLAPTTPGESFAFDNITFGWPLDYEFTESPYQLELRGWSPNATFVHTVTLHVLLEEMVMPVAAVTTQTLLQRLRSVISGE